MDPSQSIVDRVFEELTWKPVFFLYQRPLPDRQKLAPKVSWDEFLAICRETAQSSGRRLAVEEDNTRGRKLTRSAIAEYSAQLAIKSAKTMPLENAVRQAAKIHRCLMVWRSFIRVKPTEPYLNQLSSALLSASQLNLASARRVFDSFSSARYWRDSNVSGDARAEVQRLREFIRTTCHYDLDNAQRLAKGDALA